MNELQIFQNAEFGSVRSTMINEEPFFVGKDVAEILGYTNASKALADHVDEEDKLNNNSLPSLGQRGGWLINESGLYSLILSSKLPTAKRFKKWVTSEVLPAIRKTGGYQAPAPQGKELLALAVLEAQKTIEAQNQAIDRMRPKEIFADAVKASDSSILIGDLAKLLRQNGVDTGQKRLFEQLRNEGYLMKTGSSRNMPKQRYVADGLFQIKETVISNPDGSVRMTKTTKVTGKGQQYFLNKYLKKEAAV
nr:MAG TPA: repressor domain protein [Caudoviricetes sp.]